MLGSLTRPGVTIILVTWNAASHIRRALDSIHGLSYPAACIRTVVVDNASRDGTIGIVWASYPWVTALAQRVNWGYAAGSNAAMRSYPADYFALVNPDVELHPDWLSCLIAAMEADPSLGVVGGKIYYGNRTVLQHVGGMIRDNALTYHLGSGETDRGQYDTASDVDYIMGAAFVTRGDLMCRLGYLPEAYFLYFEETEYCLKVRNAGYRVAYVPSAIAYHSQELDQKRIADWRYAWKYHRSRYLFAMRNLITSTERERFLKAERAWRRTYMRGLRAGAYLLGAKIAHWRSLIRNRWLLKA
jgi:GT2 family glycosyltransferase